MGSHEAIFDFLLHYRITPHSTTLISPSGSLYNRKIRCKIPTYEEVKDNELTQRDKLSKEKTKTYFNKRFGARVSRIKVGDFVLVKQPKINKLTSKFDPKPYQVNTIKGTMITARRPNHQITRNVQHFKFLSKTLPVTIQNRTEPDQDIAGNNTKSYGTRPRHCR